MDADAREETLRLARLLALTWLSVSDADREQWAVEGVVVTVERPARKREVVNTYTQSMEYWPFRVREVVGVG